MADIEIRIVSNQRSGLMVDLVSLITSHRYTLIRQKLTHDPQGVCLTLTLQGPDDAQTALEESIALHPHILSFESQRLATDSPLPQPVAAASAQAPALQPAPLPQHNQPDEEKVEKALPSLAKDYPNIMPLLNDLGLSIAPEQRAASLYLAGRRTGFWAYKRNYELGAKLSVSDATKRVVLPAMRKLVDTDLNGSQLCVRNNPLCLNQEEANSAFFKGFIEGLLAGAANAYSAKVQVACRPGDGVPDYLLDVSA